MKKGNAEDFFSFKLDTTEEAGEEPITPEDEVEDFHEDEDFDEPLLDEAGEEEIPLEIPKGTKKEDTKFPEDDPKGKRFAYWQSEAAKAKKLAKDYETKLAEYQAVAPIAEFLRKNPKALDTIEEYAKGDAQKKTSEPALKRPEKPKRPQNFSMLEAEENPDSPSAKYLQEREAYMDSIADYYTQKEEMREKQTELLLRENNQRVERTQYIQGVSAKLQNEYDMSVADANAFITEMDAPGSLDLDTLVDYWKYKHSDNKSKTNSSEKAQQLRRRAEERANSKAPVLGGGGGGEKDTATEFTKSLGYTGRNLFEIRK